MDWAKAGQALALAGLLLATHMPVAAQFDPDKSPVGPARPVVIPQSCDAPGMPRDKALATPRLKRLLAKGVDVRIAAFGSSSTQGVGASSQAMAFPLQLQAILRRTLKHAHINVDNMGVPGEIAAETAVRILTDLAAEPPAFLIWQAGVNDGMHDVAVTRFESVLRSTIDATRRAGVEMSLVGQQYTAKLAEEPHYTAIGRSMERIAREKGIAFIDRFSAMRVLVAANGGSEEMLADDNFHLNDYGYRCMAEHIAKSIIEGLKAGNM